MRFVATAVLWLVTTVLLAVAVLTTWAQQNVVDRDGYSAFAASAAEDPQLQEAVAAELTTQVTSLLADRGHDVDTGQVSGGAAAYTAGPAFPGQFAEANQIAHSWMFSDAAQRTGDDGRWVVDLAPMLADTSFEQTLADFNVDVPETVTVPVTESAPDALQSGQLRQLTTWGPWVSIGATVLTGVFALLTLAAARARGKAFAALGVSALLVGAGGWAGLEVVRGYVDDALNRTDDGVRQIAEAMVNHAEDGLHHWLNLTLAGGGVLVAFGVVVSMLGSLLRRS